MEIISAPNGTKFIKPSFECKLYEEIDGVVYGRVEGTSAGWQAINGYSLDRHEWHLTPAAKPWYENLGKGKLCWVWDSYREDAKIELVITYKEQDDYKFKVYDTLYFNAEPLTPEEALEYIVREH